MYIYIFLVCLYILYQFYSDVLVIDTALDQYRFNVKIQNIPMMLRKVVNHPYLIQMPILPGSTIMRVDENLVESSGKLMMLDGLLKRLKKNNHKVHYYINK